MLNHSKIFFNRNINKKELKVIIKWAFENYGQRKAAYFVDQLKQLGFESATTSGISISLEDLRVPPIKKNLMEETIQKIKHTESATSNGEITQVERFQKIIYLWNVTSETLKERLIDFFKNKDPLNSVYIMAFSGARGNIGQVRQLVGMRGLMSDPNGQIIDQAIAANFREGLSITDYIISSYGARKGIVDTAIKTADSGYLTRRLVEITQGIIISELDCKTSRGVLLEKDKIKKLDSLVSISIKSLGRILAFSVLNPTTGALLAKRNQQITTKLLSIFESLNINHFIIRSPLTCECRRAVCQYCYGINIASGNLVELGETIGLIAAQSIGEPGTQLTMRTFHTGGIFTSELARQARSTCTGYIRFVPTASLKPYRTNYGQNAFFSDRESYLRIIDYSNEVVEVKIDSRTIILAQNHQCIKVNDILFEAAPYQNDRRLGQKEIKYIVAEKSGEILLENQGFPEKLAIESFKQRSKRNYIFWILSSQVFSIPFGSKIKARKSQKILKDQSIVQSQIITTVNGFIHFSKTDDFNTVTSVKIQNFFTSFNRFKFLIEKEFLEILSCKLYLSNNYNILIKPQLFSTKYFLLGFLNNNKYKTLTGGKFYSFDFPKRKKEENLSKRRKLKGQTIFYLPQSTIQTFVKRKQFKFENGFFLSKNTEIFPYYQTSFSGFLNLIGDEEIKTITITPGVRYKYTGKKINFKELEGQVFFPGEIILEKYDVQCLSCLNINIYRDIPYLLFVPIIRYEITNQQIFLKNYFPYLNLKLDENNFRMKSGESFKTDRPIQFISYPLIFDYSLNSINTEIIFEIQGTNEPNLYGNISVGVGQTLISENFIPKELEKKGVTLSFLVENKQFVEDYTVIANLNILMPWNDYIYDIKTKPNLKQSRILITTNSDYKSLFLEDYNHRYNKNSFSKVNRSFNNNLILKESGFLKQISGNHLYFQLAQPYLFSKAAIIRKLPGDFVKKQESLGLLVYERLKTGDIIQGLPKVDEILEARKPKNEALLSITQGFVTNLEITSHRFFLTVKPNFEKSNYEGNRIERLLIKKFQYVSIGQPLTEGRINPHTLLQIYFRYFFSLGLLSLYECSYRSIKKLQSLLLKSVQAIYISQGVIIADKHIELIVKEITKKVYIEYPGRTNFLPGDIIDLDQANYINSSLKDQPKLFYRPLLLGITKSSLKMDGFLAAASFQETTRVLTQAAIEGKTDWFEGLKENAITGRLIPAGTGFYENQDITYNKILLPKLIYDNLTDFTLQNQLKQKQNGLKKIITFKYNNL